MSLSTQERTNVHKLFVAMFNAAPGAIYLANITTSFEAGGRSLDGLADALGQTNIFNNLYPSSQTNVQFASQLLATYRLQANYEALTFVASLQASGMSKGQIALRVGIVIDSNTSTDPALVAAKSILNNKAIVASNYSDPLSGIGGGTATDLPTLQGVLRDPQVGNDTLTVAADSGTTPGSLTGNDTPSGFGVNVWALRSPASKGVAVVLGNGSYFYTPNANFSGADSFIYSLSDANGSSVNATVNITVTPVVTPVVTTGNNYTLTVGTDTLVGTALGDTFNATSTTLTAVDSIDGAGGIDTLNLTTAGTYTLSNGANITNVEILNLANGTNTITYNTSAGFTTINGGTGDDTIIPNTALLPLVINGGMGTDTIVLPAAYAATASGSGTFATNVTNFEKLRLTGATNQTIDLQVLGNYSDVSLSGANGLTLINLPSNGKLTLTGAGTAVAISNAAFAGGVNDIVNLTLTDGSTSGVAFAATGITASGVETANISVNDTQGTPTGAFNDTVTWLGNSVKTINVSGNAGLTLSASSTALTTVDASGITLGGFTWTASALAGTATVKGSATGTNTVNMNSATAGVNYTGGSGNDNAVLNATVSSTAALGNGNNSLALSGVTILGTYTAGTGTDSLAFFSATPNLSNATITGFENLTVVNNANITATLAQMAQFTGGVNAAGTETLNLTTAGTFTAFSTIEKYNLANGTNNFTSANVAVTVVGGTGADTFNFTANQIINFLTSVDGGNGTDTLNIGAITANLNLMALVSNIETINASGSAAVGYTFTNVNGAGVVLNFSKGASADVVQLGSGGQTLNVLGINGTAITIAGGSGADTINLSATGVGSETIRSGSVNTAIDTVANFNASGTDYFKTGVNAASVGSYIIGNADTANYLATISAGLSVVLNATGQSYLITIQTGTAAGTYLFQNTGSDTSQFDATDFFVQLTGTIGTISTANLIA